MEAREVQIHLAHRRHLGSEYDCVFAEVAMCKTRSLRAHQRIGCKVIDGYRDATDDWALLRWDWK